MYCKNCGEQMNDNQAICLKCGVATGEGNSFCPNCGGAVNPGQAICLNCGVALGQSQQNQQQYQQPQQYHEQPAFELALVSLICGILGLFSCGITSIVAIVCGAMARKRGNKGGLATAGLACGIVSVALYALFFILYFAIVIIAIAASTM